MVDDVVAFDAESIDRFVKAVRNHADSKALRKELYAGLNRVSKPVRGRMVNVIPAALPRSGGLAALVHSLTRSRTTPKAGKHAGVTLTFRARGHDIRTLTGKRLRHPVYGNREIWVTQTEGVNAAVFTDEFQAQKPEVVRAIQDVFESVARKIGSST